MLTSYVRGCFHQGNSNPATSNVVVCLTKQVGSYSKLYRSNRVAVHFLNMVKEGGWNYYTMHFKVLQDSIRTLIDCSTPSR